MEMYIHMHGTSPCGFHDRAWPVLPHPFFISPHSPPTQHTGPFAPLAGIPTPTANPTPPDPDAPTSTTTPAPQRGPCIVTHFAPPECAVGPDGTLPRTLHAESTTRVSKDGKPLTGAIKSRGLLADTVHFYHLMVAMLEGYVGCALPLTHLQQVFVPAALAPQPAVALAGCVVLSTELMFSVRDIEPVCGWDGLLFGMDFCLGWVVAWDGLYGCLGTACVCMLYYIACVWCMMFPQPATPGTPHPISSSSSLSAPHCLPCSPYISYSPLFHAPLHFMLPFHCILPLSPMFPLSPILLL